ITPQQLYAYYHIAALFLSGARFATGVTFEAAPPGTDPKPALASTSGTKTSPKSDSGKTSQIISDKSYKPFFKKRRNTPMASNGWSVGKKLTESGRGALLANPHFPYTGSNRFYQSQITVPGVINVNGASLIGTPLPLIGF